MARAGLLPCFAEPFVLRHAPRSSWPCIPRDAWLACVPRGSGCACLRAFGKARKGVCPRCRRPGHLAQGKAKAVLQKGCLPQCGLSVWNGTWHFSRIPGTNGEGSIAEPCHRGQALCCAKKKRPIREKGKAPREYSLLRVRQPSGPWQESRKSRRSMRW